MKLVFFCMKACICRDFNEKAVLTILEDESISLDIRKDWRKLSKTLSGRGIQCGRCIPDGQKIINNFFEQRELFYAA